MRARRRIGTRWSPGRRSSPRRSASGAPMASTQSPPPSACGWRASPSRRIAICSASPMHSSRWRSASSRAPSGHTHRFPLGRGKGDGDARPRRGGRLDPGRAARSPRRACWRGLRSPAAGWSALRPRSATSSEPRCARSRSRSARVRRARPRCHTSATPSWRSASAASPGSCGATRRSASRTSPSGTSETSPTPAPSGWSCPTPRSRSTTCSTSPPASSRG